MKPIVQREILGFEQWERVRRVLRPLCMSEKDRRRLAVGSHITVLFENVQTVWYQIQETLRAERIEKPDAVQEEIDIYNRLLPAPGELVATIFIEYPHQEERDAALPGLVGLERHLWLCAGEHRIAAKFENETNEGEISAVRFVRFPMAATGGETLAQLAEMGQLAIVVDHPTLTARARIDVPMARVLADDLAGCWRIGLSPKTSVVGARSVPEPSPSPSPTTGPTTGDCRFSDSAILSALANYTVLSLSGRGLRRGTIARGAIFSAPRLKILMPGAPKLRQAPRTLSRRFAPPSACQGPGPGEDD